MSALVPQRQAFQQRFGARLRIGSGHAPQAGDEGEIFDRGQLVVQQWLVGEPGDQAFGGNRIGQRIGAEHADVPCIRPGKARDHAQRRRLAGAIGAEQRKNLPGRHHQIEAVHGLKTIEGLCQAVNFQGGNQDMHCL